MLYTLQGIRALSMLGIFLFHSGLLLEGTFPVTMFFMLSGFVVFYSKSKKIETMNYREHLAWVKRKFLEMYPLHFLTFLCSIVIRWGHFEKLSAKSNIINAILNLTLLQSLVPSATFEFNGLAWFLSVTMILYVAAYWLMKMVYKFDKKSLKKFFFWGGVRC